MAKAEAVLDSEIAPRICFGWLQPYLLELDLMFSRRWDYWLATAYQGKLLAEPIPRIEWPGHGAPAAIKNIEQCLSRVHNRSRWDVFGSFVQWLLYSLGHPSQKELPRALEERDSVFWYRTFNLGLMLQRPHDYLGDIAVEMYGGKNNASAFFPTPMDICTLITNMTFQEEDARAKRVLDPCVGSGRFLLTASNYSLRLYGMDIDINILNVCWVNMLLWVPWAVSSPAWAIEGLDTEEATAVPAGLEIEEALQPAPEMPSPAIQLVTKEVQDHYKGKMEQGSLFDFAGKVRQ